MSSSDYAVVDASVWVSYLNDEDIYHSASEQWLDDWLLDEGTIVIPSIALPEVAGATSRRSANPDAGIAAIAWMERQLGIIVFDLNASLARDAARLAATLRLRGADAVYATLARRLDHPLITWDQELITRAAGHFDARTPPPTT